MSISTKSINLFMLLKDVFHFGLALKVDFL